MACRALALVLAALLATALAQAGLGPYGSSLYDPYSSAYGSYREDPYADEYGALAAPSGSFNSYWNGYDSRYGGTALYPRSYGYDALF